MPPDIAPVIGDDRVARASAPALTTPVVKSAFESDTLARITPATPQSALATARGLASAPTAPPASSAQPMLGAKQPVVRLFHVSDRACRNRPDPEGGPRREDKRTLSMTPGLTRQGLRPSMHLRYRSGLDKGRPGRRTSVARNSLHERDGTRKTNSRLVTGAREVNYINVGN